MGASCPYADALDNESVARISRATRFISVRSVVGVRPVATYEVRRLGKVCGVLFRRFLVELHADARGFGDSQPRAVELEIALEHIGKHLRRRENDLLRAGIVAGEVEMERCRRAHGT